MLLVRRDKQRNDHCAALVRKTAEMRIQPGGRLLLVEMSGTAGYERSRKFYEKYGFTAAACIPDLYDTGEAKIAFVKSLQQQCSYLGILKLTGKK